MNDTNIQSAFSEEICAAMPSDFSTRARLHYANALRKHPRFADKMFTYPEVANAEKSLAAMRLWLRSQAAYDSLDGMTLTQCEIVEAQLANARGDKAACVDKLYDAVAVLMRMIATVEGKQRLGKEN